MSRFAALSVQELSRNPTHGGPQTTNHVRRTPSVSLPRVIKVDPLTSRATNGQRQTGFGFGNTIGLVALKAKVARLLPAIQCKQNVLICKVTGITYSWCPCLNSAYFIALQYANMLGGFCARRPNWPNALRTVSYPN